MCLVCVVQRKILHCKGGSKYEQKECLDKGYGFYAGNGNDPDQPTAGEPDGQETAQPVDLKDETTSIRVTGGSGILPADTVMTAEPLTILLHTQKRTKGTSTVFRQCWMTRQCIQTA